VVSAPRIPISPTYEADVAVFTFHNNWQFTNVLSLLIVLLVLAYFLFLILFVFVFLVPSSVAVSKKPFGGIGGSVFR